MRNKEFVVCGEIHGSAQNFLLYQYLLSNVSFGAFAYEVSEAWQAGLQSYVYGHQPGIPAHIMSQWRSAQSKGLVDGKISQEFIKFLQTLRQYKESNKEFQLILFDHTQYPDGFSWNNRDRLMFANLMKEKESSHTQKPILVATGKLHTRTKPFMMAKEVRFALGYHLQKHPSLMIDIRYLSGSYFNLKLKHIPMHYRGSRPNMVLSAAKDGYVISVKKSTPITLLG